VWICLAVGTGGACFASTRRFELAGTLRFSDRAELAQLLSQEGIREPGLSRVVDDTTWGIVLDSDGVGASRLGGRPLLAADCRWPTTRTGDSLTHLATLALTELPDVEGREVLPTDGYMSFFVALDHQDELWDAIQPDDERSDLYAVIHTPGETDTHEPSGPALKEQRVKPRARLQMRYVGFGYGAWRFGIDTREEQILERIVPSANGNLAHQLLGFPRTVQDDPRRAGEVSLLHLVDDWRLEFSFLDAGSVHFYAPEADVRAARWNRVTLWTSTS
jgi:hypothetical protein